MKASFGYTAVARDGRENVTPSRERAPCAAVASCCVLLVSGTDGAGLFTVASCGDIGDPGEARDPIPELAGEAGLATRMGVPADGGDDGRCLGVLST